MGWICRCCRLENDVEAPRCLGCGTRPLRGQVEWIRLESRAARGGQKLRRLLERTGEALGKAGRPRLLRWAAVLCAVVMVAAAGLALQGAEAADPSAWPARAAARRDAFLARGEALAGLAGARWEGALGTAKTRTALAEERLMPQTNQLQVRWRSRTEPFPDRIGALAARAPARLERQTGALGTRLTRQSAVLEKRLEPWNDLTGRLERVRDAAGRLPELAAAWWNRLTEPAPKEEAEEE